MTRRFGRATVDACVEFGTSLARPSCTHCSALDAQYTSRGARVCACKQEALKSTCGLTQKDTVKSAEKIGPTAATSTPWAEARCTSVARAGNRHRRRRDSLPYSCIHYLRVTFFKRFEYIIIIHAYYIDVLMPNLVTRPLPHYARGIIL